MSPEEQLEYELTYCEIENEYSIWMSLKARVVRTAGLDSALNGEYEMHNKRMDYLLEELFSRLGGVATSELL